MARLPVDVIPQRRLLNLLRLDIDLAIKGNRAAERRIHGLIHENPNSCFSTYVLYNLGSRRSRWLASHVEAALGDSCAAVPRRRDATEPARWEFFAAKVETMYGSGS